MKKVLLALIILAAAYFGLKDIALQSYLSRGALIVPGPLVYEDKDAWAVAPATRPGGAWETPWGIDAFIILPPANVKAKHGLLSLEDDAVIADKLNALQKLSKAIPGEIPAYAPFYRAPSPATKDQARTQMYALAGDDLLTAFETYLVNDNQGRGVILIMAESAGDYARPLIDRLQEDDFISRFAGLVSFGPENSPYQQQTLKCAEVLNSACHQSVETKHTSSLTSLLYPSLAYSAPTLDVIDPAGVSAAIKIQAENVSTWLDETQPKPAEPFFATEIIQSAPIYRPGEDAPIPSPDDE